MEGSKTGLELPGIVDEVISMVSITPGDNAAKPYRAFICQPNADGYPAGDRSGKLDMHEPPHLGRLMQKIHDGRKPLASEYNYAMS